MPEFNDINQPQKNLYKGLDTNSVSLSGESSLFTDQNLPGNDLNSPSDWSLPQTNYWMGYQSDGREDFFIF